jgi:hypothetical protein
MGYFRMLWQEFRWLLAKLGELSGHPNSPFYAPRGHVLHERMKLLRQQAAEAQRAREQGVVATWNGWVLVKPAKEETAKPPVEAQRK